MDTRKKNFIHFVALNKVNALIIQQPITVTERYTRGTNSGQVKGIREIQYVPNLSTIYVDEQKKLVEKPKIEPIYLRRKPLSIPDTEINKIAFLRAHPDNEANGGKVFKELDVQKEDALQLEAFEKLDKAKMRLTEADDTLVRAISAWFLKPSYIHMDINRVKLALRNKLEENPKMNDGTSFVDSFTKFVDSKNNEEKLLTVMCIEKNVIKIVDGKKIAWADTNEIIFAGSQSQDVLDEFCLWLKNDKDGRMVTSALTEKVK